MNTARQWDIFCKVIDNYGDIGVCWRLSVHLAALGQRVRLWVDDASAMGWMAPQGCPGVEVRPWSADTPAALQTLPPADVLLEAFGCELGDELVACYARPDAASSAVQPHRQPVWINLEYLSAEPLVERLHGLPSPVMRGPGAGWTKYFFYPGFTPATGGLLREADLLQRQAAFNPQAWLAQRGIDPVGARLVSLFCYEPPAMGELLERWVRGPQPTHLLVTAGRSQAGVRAHFQRHGQAAMPTQVGALTITELPWLSQQDYDHLLWACELNFVRGEDSMVRALWSGKPFIWNIYPQHDDAHHGKLEAFLDVLQAPPSLRRFHQVWNDAATGTLPETTPEAWRQAVLGLRQRLLQQPDLARRLLQFLGKTR